MTSLTATKAADLFRRPPDDYLDVGQGEVAYRRVGTGPEVLLVHGWPVSGATYRTLLPYLVDHVTCHVIDFPGAGSSRFSSDTRLTFDQHIQTVRRTIDLLGLDDVAVVGHNSGGMIARHAMAGDRRLRGLGLLNTEQSQGLNRYTKALLRSAKLPGFGPAFTLASSHSKLRRSPFVWGSTVSDPSHLDGEFEEFFLRPLREIRQRRLAAVRLARNFDNTLIDQLVDVHRRIDAPVRLVWGDRDPFFPIADAEGMIPTFPKADLVAIKRGRLFAHEERPAEVAEALLPVLVG